MTPSDDTCDREPPLRLPEPPPPPSPALLRRAERGWAEFLRRAEGPVRTGDAS
ncbi:hypothetical protein [Streptomyces halstedii]|uniref:hypothetical protein n=1 Tax=Streptomyces halstedii TaxID=1944 RepID=UPI00081B3658|nr:hypothetical protein GA0115247_117735 [Streptomyces sp. PalvLS-984]SDD59375.1 hypothetical protein F558DRAFT_04403 [Streptomyces sp. AmelKG-A3]